MSLAPTANKYGFYVFKINHILISGKYRKLKREAAEAEAEAAPPVTANNHTHA